MAISRVTGVGSPITMVITYLLSGLNLQVRYQVSTKPSPGSWPKSREIVWGVWRELALQCLEFLGF